jgi:hypothetical protein
MVAQAYVHGRRFFIDYSSVCLSEELWLVSMDICCFLVERVRGKKN